MDRVKLGLRTLELKEVGVIVFTLGATPSRKAIENWCTAELTKKRGVHYTQIRVLDNNIFLIPLDGAASRKKFLGATPLMLNSRMALVIPFDPELDISSLQYKNTAVWIDLIDMPPILEIEADSMLAEVGPSAAFYYQVYS
jgi:hypothetical protein